MRRAGKAGWIRAGLFSLVVGSALVSGPGARAENIVDALVGAYNTSGLLEQNRAVLRSADEDVALAVSSLRPVVDFILRASRTFNATGSDLVARTVTNRSGLTAQFSATWLLWDGGETRLSIEEAKETVLATRQQLLGIEQQILLRAAGAYVDVLLQQENVLLRRNNDLPERETVLQVADLVLDLLSRELRCAGRSIALPATELRLLEFLMRNPDALVTRALIFEVVWGYHFDPGTKLIDVHLTRLRKRLENLGCAPVITTLRGSGFKLVTTAANP